ncbi:MAG: GNAT family N-acetyltransferase, partial [Candidatus Rokuibacteriota bacterium]
IAGYAALVQNRVGWQRHLGEIRTQVALRFRSQGLGRALAGEIFSLARGRGLRKIVAQMTPDQKGAMATFERLGFRPEALLQDFVVDHSGRTRDLVVRSTSAATRVAWPPTCAAPSPQCIARRRGRTSVPPRPGSTGSSP